MDFVTRCCLSSLFSWYSSAIASFAYFSCWYFSWSFAPTTSILLILLPLSQLVCSKGYRRTTQISNCSTIGRAHGSCEIWVSPTSLFFLGFPLLWGICFWGKRASTILPSYVVPSTPSSVQCDVSIPLGKRKIPLSSLGMPVVSENESQSLWGLGLAILPLHAPLFMLW